MIWIILPIRNESATIDNTIMKLNKMIGEASRYRVIFVDDHSTDNTLYKIREFKNRYPYIQAIYNKGPQGKGSALKYAFEFISAQEKEIMVYEEVVFLDGDGQIESYDIVTGIHTMNRYSCSVAIGNKRHKYSQCKYSLIRSIVSQGYNLMIRLLFGVNISDTQCGLKIFRYHALKAVLDKVTTKGFAFDIELLIALKAVNFRIVDFPVSVNQQINNGSVNFKNIFNTFLDTCRIFIRYKKNYYKNNLEKDQ